MAALSTSRLRVRVIPVAGKPGIVGRHGETWKVRVAAPPERGKANDATLRLLAESLGLASSDLRLVSGHGSRDKTVEISGLTVDEAERRLAQ